MVGRESSSPFVMFDRRPAWRGLYSANSLSFYEGYNLAYLNSMGCPLFMTAETTQLSLCSLTAQRDCMYLVVPNVWEWVTMVKVILTAGFI